MIQAVSADLASLNVTEIDSKRKKEVLWLPWRRLKTFSWSINWKQCATVQFLLRERHQKFRAPYHSYFGLASTMFACDVRGESCVQAVPAQTTNVVYNIFKCCRTAENCIKRSTGNVLYMYCVYSNVLLTRKNIPINSLVLIVLVESCIPITRFTSQTGGYSWKYITKTKTHLGEKTYDPYE